jgi:hypothetical protein
MFEVDLRAFLREKEEGGGGTGRERGSERELE